MTHEHEFRLNKQIDNSYLLTCSCHDTLTIGQMNRRLAENERLRELSLALIENGYMDKNVPDFRVDISYYRDFKDEVLIQQQKHDALKEGKR